MLSVLCLLLPQNSSTLSESNEGHVLEALLVQEGFAVRKGARNHSFENTFMDVDVILFEVRSVDDVQQFRQLRGQSKVPVMLYGSGVPSSTWIQGLRAGADAFLDLPDREDVVRARLLAFLRRAGLRPYRTQN